MVRIIHNDLQLKYVKKKRARELTVANRLNRLQRSQRLLDKFSEHEVGFIFFTDEKLFTMAPPMNSQNDRVYTPVATKKRDISASRLLRTRPTFSKSVMVSVAVSKLSCTNLIFIEPGAKVNGKYYRDMLLMQQLLPRCAALLDTCSSSSKTTHQRIALVTVKLLRREMSQFISPDMWPANSRP